MEKSPIKMEKMEKKKPKIAIVNGPTWLEQCDRIPKVEKRVSLNLSFESQKVFRKKSKLSFNPF